MGLRLILLLAALWVLFLAVRRVLRRPPKETGRSRPAVDTVSCAYCGIHIPKDEALMNGNLYFCCKEHIQRNKRTN